MIKTFNPLQICQELQTNSNITLARKYGVHRTTIYEWRKRLGIPRFTPKGECRKRIVTLLEQDACRTGVTIPEMVAVCNCTRQKLYWILKEMIVAHLVYATGATLSRRWYLNDKE